MKQFVPRGRACRHDRHVSRRKRLGRRLKRPTPPAGPQATQAAQQPAAPQGPQPPAGRGGRGGLGGTAGERSGQRDRRSIAEAAGRPLTPEEEAKRFWLPPGYSWSPCWRTRSSRSPAQIAFDGNGRMFVARAARLHAGRRTATDELDPIGRISLHEDRDNDGVYETHTVFVDKLVFPRFVDAVRRQRDPDEGVERRRGVEVHRHERRRRRRQEGAVRHRLRPARQRRAPAERPILGDGQLAVQHRQRVPRCAGRRTGVLQGADRTERRRSGA